MNRSNPTFHYIYDPLCGWCYGAAPLLQALSAMPDIAIALHAGGLWLGDRRRPTGQALRDYVRPHDQRIEALTGQHFGDRYFNELLLREGGLLDSEPAIRAVESVLALGGDGLKMLHRIQRSHYQDGLWAGELPYLASLAAEQGLDHAAFEHAYHQVNLGNHLAESQDWLRRMRGQGYPTLGVEIDTQITVIPVMDFLGQPELFYQHIATLLRA
ncbi:DsbA family protein [Aquitalea sp. S1-19]|nr:DsbA family protein [Aquitalea sp. S1-19]